MDEDVTDDEDLARPISPNTLDQHGLAVVMRDDISDPSTQAGMADVVLPAPDQLRRIDVDVWVGDSHQRFSVTAVERVQPRSRDS